MNKRIIISIICAMLTSLVFAQTYFETFYNKAMQGDSNAQYRLGFSYYWGENDIKKDLKESFKWFLKAAEGGLVYAQTQVGYMNYSG